MLRLQRIANDEVVLAVIGYLQGDNVDELSLVLAREPPGRTVVLDLKDLIMVDREAVHLLRECQAKGITLRNCPTYIRVWLAYEEEKP